MTRLFDAISPESLCERGMGVPQNIHKVSLWEIQVNLRHIWAYTKKDVVGDTGIEPVTSSVSRKRASPCANRPLGCFWVLLGGA